MNPFVTTRRSTPGRLAPALAPLAIAAFLAVAPPATRAAEEIFAVTTSNTLVNFNSSSPWFFSSRPITGMMSGENALGIDFRPALPLGRLYVLGSTGRLYRVDDPFSGVAALVTTTPFALSGSSVGFDFNPTVDRIRVITDADQNIRLNPDTGNLAATDPPLAYAAADANFGANPSATGGGYTNSVPAAASTLLYDIDSSLDILVTQNPANNGTLNTVGSLGLDANGVNGFDISGYTGIAYAALNTGGPQSNLYTVNLATGLASDLGLVGCQEPLRGLAVYRELPTPVESSTWSRIKSLTRD
ncbi:MAG TPA: DUF4394 domain-containing protein [Candidatus Eisenbacteria bacterium]